MRKRVIWSISAVVLVAIALAVLISTLNSLKPKNSSNESLYFYEDGNPRVEGKPLVWDANVTGSTSGTAPDSEFTCPQTSTQAFAFLSALGQEREIQGGWKAFSQTYLKPDHRVLQPNLTISGLIEGEPGPRTVQRTGGDFSLGLACTHGGNSVVDSVSYRYVKVTAGTGEWSLTEKQ
jgi:hypothetical protein